MQKHNRKQLQKLYFEDCKEVPFYAYERSYINLLVELGILDDMESWPDYLIMMEQYRWTYDDIVINNFFNSMTGRFEFT